MKKNIIALSLLVSAMVHAGGYKIPEVSTNAVALGAATIAHSHGADTAYYNPANMSFMQDTHLLEADAMGIVLKATKFKGEGEQDGDSFIAKQERFLLPSLNYVSPKFGNTRFGLSMVVPGGLTKRWSDSPAKDSAEEFALEVVEINPSVSYLITNNLSIAIGARVLYSKGVVKSSSSASRSMEGDSLDYGYNLALAYKATSNLELGLTYRSNVDLSEEGNAKLYIGDAKVYDGGSSVSVPLPAMLNVAAAYTFESKTTIELVYERAFWSAYNDLDFEYSSAIPTILRDSFDSAIEKNWEDTNAIRLGVTQELDSLTIMLGAVFDTTPVPDEKVSYELPDSNSMALSMGVKYHLSEQTEISFATLYSMRESRDVSNEDIEGEFSNSDVIVASMGIGYKF
jgi:long-chain fatty acid transport protein